ncbi:fumarylacetoacetate hydrolase family protein [Paenibacillus doosanensis]|uniref:fumarylacetoacetate hydrolase family protein n=1 Tax=Paenibacillus doosanensis TaxID=1229154 RepID=UPI0021806887|nr:fumarylacetoacetate hydrolase family protein [Paenibacillus doosanensis]MCS7462912.1 fumarylacetoacetate hydrolase family protein [Paenibacillus doosanensis]
MQFVRFTLAGETDVRSGTVESGIIREFTGDMFGDFAYTGRQLALGEAALKAPLAPCHIIGVGKNFAADDAVKPPAPELPVLFFKPQTSVIGPGEAIVLPQAPEPVKYEAELAVVIGKTARNVPAEHAGSVIFGFTVSNDMSASGYYHPDGHWTVGKSFDTFCPLGPVIETDFDYRSARIQSNVNGVPKQNSPIERMITPVDRLIAFISRFMTLSPGDVILTGTPPGAVAVQGGDVVDCFIDGIGHLINPVQAAD